jgi:hypothetical protein
MLTSGLCVSLAIYLKVGEATSNGPGNCPVVAED